MNWDSNPVLRETPCSAPWIGSGATVTSKSRTVLVVAAEPLELRWIRASGDNVRFVRVANGPGPKLAREAMKRIKDRPSAVLSTGLCGALDPRFRIADIVVATSVNHRAVQIPRTTVGCWKGPVVSMDRVVGSAAEKRKLAATGAVAVEMEAAAVLECARHWGVPFYCIRAVSDLADEDFVLDLNAGRRRDGRFSAGRIVVQAMRHPVRGIPELFRLRRNSLRAARALGDFVANCDF